MAPRTAPPAAPPVTTATRLLDLAEWTDGSFALRFRKPIAIDANAAARGEILAMSWTAKVAGELYASTIEVRAGAIRDGQKAGLDALIEHAWQSLAKALGKERG